MCITPYTPGLLATVFVRIAHTFWEDRARQVKVSKERNLRYQLICLLTLRHLFPPGGTFLDSFL